MADEGTELLSGGLKLVLRFRLGRILLWVFAALVSLFIIAMQPDIRGFWGVVMVVVLTALTILAFGPKRKKKSRVGGMVFRLGLAAFSLGIVAFLLWLKGRRGGKVEALPPPPQPEEIDQLARLELEEERAA